MKGKGAPLHDWISRAIHTLAPPFIGGTVFSLKNTSCRRPGGGGGGNQAMKGFEN